MPAFGIKKLKKCFFLANNEQDQAANEYVEWWKVANNIVHTEVAM